MGMAILLAGGAATGASAAVTSTPAPVAPQITTTASPQAVTPAAPGAPTGLTATPGNGTVTLSWSAPASDGGSPVDGYVIQGGTSPSDASITDQVTGTTATMSGLTNGTMYFFRVNAHNSSGDGAAATVTVTPNGPGSDSGSVPSAPTGLRVSPGDGFVALSWSPPAGGLKASEGYLIYMGTSSGHEGAKPSVPHLIENATSYTIAPLQDGTRYYFQVALLDGTQVSARSAEVSAVPVAAAAPGSTPGAGTSPGPTPGAGNQARSGVGKNAQPATSPRPATELAQHRASSSPPAVLIILLAALSLAATGAAIAIAAIQRRRRRHGQGYAPVPAPRHPHDDRPPRASSQIEELNGPRYR
jgi:Fibronectin type III domain